MMRTLYGIKHCDTMKKAFKQLDALGLDYHFHDYKTAGIDAATLKRWLNQVGQDTLVNRRSTTWRQLSDAEKQLAQQSTEQLILLLIAKPTLIKRPVLDTEQGLIVGFSAENYQQLAD